jgi:hypothetical protein
MARGGRPEQSGKYGVGLAAKRAPERCEPMCRGGVKLFAQVIEENDCVITDSRPLPKCAALLCRLPEIP